MASTSQVVHGAGTPTPTGYLQVACTAWFLYDWALTIEDEIDYIWRRRWTFTKVLYILIRLTTLVLLGAETAQYVFLENLSKSQCDIFSWALAIATAVVIVEVDIVLQLRVYVMYQRSRRILWTNAALCVLNVACAAIILVFFFSETQFVAVPPWIQGSCYDVRSEALGAVWVAPLCYELYLTLLTVHKLVRDYRLFGRMEEQSSLLSVLVRDSVVYFILLVVVVALNVVFWAGTRITPGDSAVNLIHSAGGIGGTRIILSMREAALRPISVINDTALSTTFEMHAMKRASRRSRDQRTTEDNAISPRSNTVVDHENDEVVIIAP
ncbi:hypothetical protein EXIGLDRAFT_729889 [Exidia glandulosa HHB12029]|uniref:DUF6533 domain-containing protein n=1 Tax=Exidia glandulosa HHB12029 TaxID=1314781 RepID=A0A165LG33_EXIGL|nr:hypothetical protein EXIGLDRAFT_729889 [Exidia glandulosa HHB12029]